VNKRQLVGEPCLKPIVVVIKAVPNIILVSPYRLAIAQIIKQPHPISGQLEPVWEHDRIHLLY